MLNISRHSVLSSHRASLLIRNTELVDTYSSTWYSASSFFFFFFNYSYLSVSILEAFCFLLKFMTSLCFYMSFSVLSKQRAIPPHSCRKYLILKVYELLLSIHPHSCMTFQRYKLSRIMRCVANRIFARPTAVLLVKPDNVQGCGSSCDEITSFVRSSKLSERWSKMRRADSRGEAANG